MLLEVKNLSVNYGSVKALENTSFNINEGEIVSMLGPNGAGKSTALKAIAGLLDHYDGQIINGRILFNNENITNIDTDKLVQKSIALIPERRQIFPTMTVQENLEMGAFINKNKIDRNALIEEVYLLLPKLSERRKQSAGTMSTGEQQILALGRALMMKPKLILADEPSLGLSPNYIEILFDKLKEINLTGVSILLVEQNARMALEISHRAYILDIGKINISDTATNLKNNPEVIQTYLGG